MKEILGLKSLAKCAVRTLKITNACTLYIQLNLSGEKNKGMTRFSALKKEMTSQGIMNK
jgi:hypothetical protein